MQQCEVLGGRYGGRVQVQLQVLQGEVGRLELEQDTAALAGSPRHSSQQAQQTEGQLQGWKGEKTQSGS